MKIHWHRSDGRKVVAHLPYAGAEQVVAKAACPVCAGKCVLVAHDIKQTAIFPESRRAEAEADLRTAGATAWEEVRPLPDVRLRGIGDKSGDEYHDKATAQCCRCYSEVGTLVVTYDSLYGKSEDRRIMSGRYGIII